jgi:hypothetical protein
MNVDAFWAVAPSSLVVIDQHFTLSASIIRAQNRRRHSFQLLVLLVIRLGK